MKDEKNIKAVGLISGGLDSVLAATVVHNMGIEVLGMSFDIGSYSPSIDGNKTGKSHFSENLPFNVDIISPSQEYLDMVANPEHGYGSAVNPCIDCKIFMLKEARKKMQKEGASFVFTGEVLGQRPMSQNRQAMDTIEASAGVKGYLVRPLCAKLLPETIPEQNGIIERDKLYGFNGRARKAQMNLAKELKLEQYQQPAGGCFLTEEVFGKKFSDFLYAKKERKINYEEILLLQIGRHLRISDKVKAVIGRNEKENDYLENNFQDKLLIKVADYPGATLLVDGLPDKDELLLMASIVSRYSGAKKLDTVKVSILSGDNEKNVTVKPASPEEIDKYRFC